jgi:hypothetical protein
MSDLWPRDIVEGITLQSPANILREQGEALGRKTKNLVPGKVIRLEEDWASPTEDFTYAFYLVGPTLNYQYMLFTFSCPIEYFPLAMRVHDSILRDLPLQASGHDEMTGILTVESEDEFKDALRQIFASKKTRRVVQAIYVESGGNPDQPW